MTAPNPTGVVRAWRYRPYPKYKNSGVDWLADIPAHWDVRRLKHIAAMQAGDAITSESIDPSGDYPVFGGNGIRGFTSSFTHEGKFPLIGRQGALCGCVNLAAGKFWASEHAVVARPLNDVDPIWLAGLLSAMSLNTYSQSAAQPGLAVETIRGIHAPVPPLCEQRAIAAFLDHETARINALVKKNERLISLLEEQRATLITRAVTKGLDPNVQMQESGVEWLGKIPAHWLVSRTKFAARLRSGHTPSRQHPEYWLNCTIPWFGLADVWQIRDGRIEYVYETAEKISELGLANSAARLLPKGTIILSRTASVGFSAILGVDAATTQDFVNWVCGPTLRPEYLLYVFRSMQHEFRRLTMGSTHQTIYMPDVGRFSTPLPPLAEQDQIVAAIRQEISGIDILVSKVRGAIARLQELRTALISAAVTGKIDVREAAA